MNRRNSRSISLAAALLIFLGAGNSSNAALLAHYPLDSDASDALGGNNGSVVGGTVNFGQPGANGNTGSSASFPDNGHIDVPFSSTLNPGIEAPDGSGSFTWAVWVNAEGTAGHNSPITARADLGTSVNGPIIYNTPGNVWSFWGGNNGPSGAWNPLDASVGTTIGEWQHIAVTYDSDTTTKNLWVNGESVASHAVGISANTVRDLHIGAGQDDGNNFFWSGSLDDVGIWDTALSQAEIQSVMTNGVPEPSVAVLIALAGLGFVVRRRSRR